jgi:hypothetical protein
MKITLKEMVEVAKRLPIGYYLGRKTPVIVEVGMNAYCTTVNGEIHIGIGLLQRAADNIDPSKADKWDKEVLLRCLLYHEIGHLLLTPKYLKYITVIKPDGSIANVQEGHAIINIFEDERIEQLLASTFYGVDFKAFCLLVNKNADESNTFTDKFFDAVRLRKTSPSKSAAIDNAICRLKNYTALSEYLDEYKESLNALIQELFKDDEEKSEQSKQEQSKDKGEGQSSKSEGDSEDDKGKGSGGEEEAEDEEESSSASPSPNNSPNEEENPANNPASEEEKDDENAAGEDKEPTGAKGVRSPITPGFLKELASVVFGDPTQDIQNTLNRFANRLAKKRGAQTAGCWSGLHGRIETKRDAMDKDKIFRRKSDVGDKLMQSVNLTLWVDHSGSFYSSRDKLNQILTAVYKTLQMTAGKLNVNVVKMEEYATVARPNEWAVNPLGDNSINDTYAAAWERTRKKDRRNIDIVVFDGACGCAAYNLFKGSRNTEKVKLNRKYEVGIANKIWNSHDCWVVSDEQNRKFFTLAMPKAHITYIESDYAEHLQAKVMEILDRIL